VGTCPKVFHLLVVFSLFTVVLQLLTGNCLFRLSHNFSYFCPLTNSPPDSLCRVVSQFTWHRNCRRGTDHLSQLVHGCVSSPGQSLYPKDIPPFTLTSMCQSISPSSCIYRTSHEYSNIFCSKFSHWQQIPDSYVSLFKFIFLNIYIFLIVRITYWWPIALHSRRNK